MKAKLLVDRRIAISETAFAEMVLWKVPTPVRASNHAFKYRLALIVDGRCVLRFDNEAGKGDHMHIGGVERSYGFVDPDRLVADFMTQVNRWIDENRHA
jgi:hypothetical protein